MADYTLIHKAPYQTHTHTRSHKHTHTHAYKTKSSNAAENFFSPPLLYKAVSMATSSSFWHRKVETCRKYERPPGSWQEAGWRTGSVVIGGGGVLKSWGSRGKLRECRHLLVQCRRSAAVSCSLRLLSSLKRHLFGGIFLAALLSQSERARIHREGLIDIRDYTAKIYCHAYETEALWLSLKA